MVCVETFFWRVYSLSKRESAVVIVARDSLWLGRSLGSECVSPVNTLSRGGVTVGGGGGQSAIY